MKSEDLALNVGFSMVEAIRLAYDLSELRSHAEYIAYVEEQKEYPDDVLIEAGEEVIQRLKQLVECLAELKLEEGIKEAKARVCGPTVVVKKTGEN